MLTDMLARVRESHPLIHNITNYVTVNDCANVLLACGASPIMADEPDEVSEITSICGGLTINLGTLNRRKIDAMLIAGRRANALSHPVVLDPVGVGSSQLRMDTAMRLLSEVKFAAIRGNISEIRALASSISANAGSAVSVDSPQVELSVADSELGTQAPDTRSEARPSVAELKTLTAGERSEVEPYDYDSEGKTPVSSKSSESNLLESGVDANTADTVTESDLDELAAFAKAFAAKTGSVVIITGAIDVVADSEKAYCIRNGHSMMSKITGSGCMLSCMVAAYVTANPEHPLEAAAAAVCAMGYAGEIAHARMSKWDGNASFRNYLIDAIFNMTPECLMRGAKYEMR